MNDKNTNDILNEITELLRQLRDKIERITDQQTKYFGEVDDWVLIPLNLPTFDEDSETFDDEQFSHWVDWCENMGWDPVYSPKLAWVQMFERYLGYGSCLLVNKPQAMHAILSERDRLLWEQTKTVPLDTQFRALGDKRLKWLVGKRVMS